MRSRPIVSLCTVLENVVPGHYIREICYTPDRDTECGRAIFSAFEKRAICHDGALNPAQNVEVLRKHLLAYQLDDDIEQSSVRDIRKSSDPRVAWSEEFIEHLRIDYGLYLRILLPLAPNLTTLEISWNFHASSAINEFIKTASDGARPFLQHLAKVTLLLGQRPDQMSIGVFMTVPSLRWLSVHHLCRSVRGRYFPESVGYTNLERLELVDCEFCDEDLHYYLDMFHSLEHVDIHMMKR